MNSSETQTADRDRSQWLTRQRALALVFVAITAIAFLLCYAMVQPFLAPMAWAIALAVVVHPLHLWLEGRTRSANLAALLTTALVSIALLTPTVFVAHRLVQEAAAHIDFTPAPDGHARWREHLQQTIHGSALLWLDQRIDLGHQIDLFLESLANRAAEILRDSAWIIANVLVTIFSLFFLLRDWRAITQEVRSLLPLSSSETDEFFGRIADTIRGTIKGSLVISIMQGLLGTLVFWWLDLPAPMLWGLVLAVLATIPCVGTVIVWGPTAVGLMLQDRWGSALILIAWELIAVGLVDNLLYPIVVGSHLRMHTLAIFFAILGGLIAFGPAGIILGPLVFALTDALITIWRRRTAGGRGAEFAVSPGPVHNHTPSRTVSA